MSKVKVLSTLTHKIHAHCVHIFGDVWKFSAVLVEKSSSKVTSKYWLELKCTLHFLSVCVLAYYTYIKSNSYFDCFEKLKTLFCNSNKNWLSGFWPFQMGTQLPVLVNNRVALRLSDSFPHQTSWRSNHLKWLFTKIFFWKMFHFSQITAQSLAKQLGK